MCVGVSCGSEGLCVGGFSWRLVKEGEGQRERGTAAQVAALEGPWCLHTRPRPHTAPLHPFCNHRPHPRAPSPQAVKQEIGLPDNPRATPDLTLAVALGQAAGAQGHGRGAGGGSKRGAQRQLRCAVPLHMLAPASHARRVVRWL